jgi:hypothetical protein
MKRIFKFWNILMHNLWKSLDSIEAVIGILGILGAIFLVIPPTQLLMPSWFTPYWSRMAGVAIIFILLLVGAYKAWNDADIEREKLLAEKESKAADVNLESFARELQYDVNRNRNGLIEIYLDAELINHSMTNEGRLRDFRLEINTQQQFLPAKAERPELNYLFAPNSIYPSHSFCFRCRMADEDIGIESWEPYIRGAEGTIILNVLGQKKKTYKVKIANQGRSFE